jgi:glycine betaine transporter
MNRRRYVTVFSISIVICGAVAIWGLWSANSLRDAAQSLTGFCLTHLDWFFLLSCTFFLALGLYLAFSKYGKIKLGSPDDKPEFHTVSWLAMLFAAGMGAGLLFWGAAEPLMHYLNPPPGYTGQTPEAARYALVVTNFHWGLHAWGIYAISGLCLGYFGFRKGLPLLASSPIQATFGGRLGKYSGAFADIISVLAVVFGVTGSLGGGVLQIRAGFHSILGTPEHSVVVAIAVLLLLTAAYMTSAGTSLDKGIQILSNVNMAMAVALLLFILFAGPTGFLLSAFVTSLGDYLSNLVALSTRLFPYSGDSQWSRVWTLTYMIWWIAWAPFVGIFIARISRGRTIREFMIGVILVPTLFSVLWFAVFGGTVLHIELFGEGGLRGLVLADVEQTLFSMLDYFPLSWPLTLLTLVLIFAFLVTSADSATFVLGMMTTRGALNPPTWKKLTWGIVIALLTASTLFAEGGILVMRAIAIVGAIPFTVVMILHILCLLKYLRSEPAADGRVES